MGSAFFSKTLTIPLDGFLLMADHAKIVNAYNPQKIFLPCPDGSFLTPDNTSRVGIMTGCTMHSPVCKRQLNTFIFKPQ